MLQMLVCDLDGTLLMRGRPFATADVETLNALGAKGVVRVIATGRALATALHAIPREFPIDYLIFSSGAGIFDWRAQTLLVTHTLQPHQVLGAIDTFMQCELDFMVHAPVPEQHIFQYHRTGKLNPDFERRLARYAAHGRVFDRSLAPGAASQLLAVSPSSDPDEPYERVRRALPDLSVIRATSPLDDRSMWIEAFAPEVSKSQAAAWLARTRSIATERCCAIGNDYNDWDLLRWAGRGAVVPAAPAAMCAEFTVVNSLAEWLGGSRGI